MKFILTGGAAAQPGYASRFDNLKPNDKSLRQKKNRKEKIGFPAVCLKLSVLLSSKAKGTGWGLRADVRTRPGRCIKNIQRAVNNKADVKIIYESRQEKR